MTLYDEPRLSSRSQDQGGFRGIINRIRTFHAKLPREEAQEALSTLIVDAQAQGFLSEQVAELQSLHNEHAPISRLQPEVLGPILARAVPSRASWKDRGALTLICRHWRKAALSCQLFWADIPIVPSAHLPTMLSRSGQTPIQLCVGSCTIEDLEELVAFRRYSQLLFDPCRLQHLSLRGVEPAEAEEVLQMLSAVATPRLLSFVLEFAEETPGTFPQGLLQSHGSTFQAVTLSDCDFPLTTFIPAEIQTFLPNITYLALNYIIPRLTPHEIAAALTGMTHLRVFSLVESLSDEHGWVGPDTRTLKLPLLSSLTIADQCYAPLLGLYRAIDHHPSTTVHLDLGPDQPDPVISFEDVAEALLSHYGISRSHSSRASKDVFIAIEPQMLAIRIRNPSASNHPWQDTSGRTWPTAIQPTTIRLKFPPRTLLRLLSIPGVQVMRVDIGEDHPNEWPTGCPQEEDWCDLLDRHPGIESFQVSGGTSDTLINALSYVTSGPGQFVPLSMKPIRSAVQELLLGFVRAGTDIVKPQALEAVSSLAKEGHASSLHLQPGAEAIDSDNSAQGSKLLVPNLTELSLQSMQFNCFNFMDCPGLHAIIPVILGRRALGSPIQVLYLKQLVGFNRYMVNLLESVVGSSGAIEWDWVQSLPGRETQARIRLEGNSALIDSEDEEDLA